MPWDLDTQAPNVPLTYEELTKWATRLKASKDDINRGRLFQLINLASPHSISRAYLELVNAGRYRACKGWGQQESQEQDNLEEEYDDLTGMDVKEYVRSAQEDLQDDANDLSITGFEVSSNNREATNLATEICHMFQKSVTVNVIQDPSGDMTSVLSDDRQRNLRAQMRDVTGAKEASKIIFKIKATKNADDVTEEDDDHDDDDDSVFSTDLDAYDFDDDGLLSNVDPTSILAPIAVEERHPYPVYAEPEGLNAAQRNFFKTIFDYYIAYLKYEHEGAPMPEAPLIMLDGAAGTGKTWVLSQMILLLGEDLFVTVAATGSAAYQMQGNGTTAHAFFNIKVMNKTDKKNFRPQLDKRPMKTVENVKLNRCRFIIIDEISLVPPHLFTVWLSL